MDYVVFGIGFGATLLVLGLLIRDVGPRLRYRNPSHPDGVFHAEELVARVSWSRFCGALGSVWAIAGALFVVITAVGMMFMMSDDTGGQVMISALAVLFVIMVVWTWAFFDRFGSYGILPERDTEEPVIAPQATEREAPTPATVVRAGDSAAPDDSRSDTDESEAPAASVTEIAEQDQEPDGDADELAASDTGQEPADKSETAQEEPLPTPEERMAGAVTPLDHESLEADLDIPVRSKRRPGGRLFRPATPAVESSAAREISDTEPDEAPLEERQEAEGATQEEDSSKSPPSASRGSSAESD